MGAETSDGLLAGLSRVAERLDVADPEGDSAESARRLREHLTSRAGRGLLVFDNAVDPDGLRLFLPAAGGTQIVVTSTDRSFAELGEMVEVSVFSRQQSFGFLRARAGLALTRRTQTRWRVNWGTCPWAWPRRQRRSAAST